jgi:hypothetical protein
MSKALDGRRLIFYTQQPSKKYAGVTEGGWDRPRDCARTLRECDGNDRHLAEGDDNDDNKYSEDGNIPDDNNEYSVGIDGVNEPLDKGNNECGTLSTASARAYPESQQPSVPSR